jgi:hypothetical protein
MKFIHKSTWLIAAAFSSPVIAQQPSLSSSLEVYAFPANGQAAEQQSMDESECYQWAMTNTGVDPFQSMQNASNAQQQAAQTQQQAAQASQGAGARGVVGGAAAGAIIGEIADDEAGKGAAYGAAAGVIIGRSRARRSQAAAQSQGQSQVQQAMSLSSSEIASFKMAFSTCLQGKGYQVNY